MNKWVYVGLILTIIYASYVLGEFLKQMTR